VADPNGPYSGTVGAPVSFDGSGSTDPDGTIVAYNWEFGDGSTGTGVSPTHTYGAAGTFTVTLTVTDNAGATDTASTTATIADVPNAPPVADPNGPYTGTVGVAVTFDGTGSSDPDGTIVAWDWDFGDGNTGTDVSPTHTYATAGTFTVTLTVTDDEGATDSASTTATVSEVPNLPPVADPNGPYTGTVGVAVTFDGTGSSDPDGTIVDYEWDLGDGAVATGPTPTHTYGAAGTFTVTLTVTDDAGATDSASTTATIAAGNLPPVADPNGPYTGTVGVAVQFDGSGSSDPGGTIVGYDWDFGDGNTGIGPTPMHAYGTDGIFNVSLTVTDDAGAADSATTTATISAPGLVDLDPVQLRNTKRVSLRRPKPVVLTLVVKNNGSEEGEALAAITGVQNGLVVYSHTLTVTDPVGNGRTKYDDDSVPSIPPFTPTEAGDILWEATIADEDPDIDEITAVTRVVGP
jgi:PKD repeat protein